MPPFAAFFAGHSGQESLLDRSDPRHLCADHVEYFVAPAPVGIDHELVPFTDPGRGRSTRARIPRRANTPYSIPPPGGATHTRPLSAIRPDNARQSHIQHPRNVHINVDAEDQEDDSFEMDAEGYLERSNLPLPAYPDDVPAQIRRGTRPAATVMNVGRPQASGSGGLIPRPEGEVGRPHSGGYCLKDALGLDDKEYELIRTFVNKQVDEHLNCRASLTSQEATPLELVRNNISNAYSFFSRYEKKWPIDDFIKAHLKSAKALVRQRDTREENAQLHNQVAQMNRRPNLRSADTARG